MFDRNVLDMDLEQEATRVCAAYRETVAKKLLRRGVVVAISGGIDSSCTAGLAVRAFGPKKVFGLLLPERDSSGASVKLGRQLAEHLGIEYVVEDIEPTLRAIGCYDRYDKAIQRVIPEFGEGWKSKIVLPGDLLDSDRVSVYRVVVEDPDGEQRTERLPL
ncbi:NAD(+) synthase, partial [bacterium]